MEIIDEKKSFKEQVKEAPKKVKDWCVDHRQEILVFGPILIGIGVDIYKTTKRSHIQKEEQRLKENFIYDRTFGHYFEMSRQPKPSEWSTIDIRRKRGEYLGDILRSMDLLKK